MPRLLAVRPDEGLLPLLRELERRGIEVDDDNRCAIERHVLRRRVDAAGMKVQGNVRIATRAFLQRCLKRAVGADDEDFWRRRHGYLVTRTGVATASAGLPTL